MSAMENSMIWIFRKTSSSLRTWEVFVSLVASMQLRYLFSAQDFHRFNMKVMSGKLNLQLFRIYPVITRALTSLFVCHIWLQAGERKLSKSNFNFPVASSRSANCERNFICTSASGCLRVLSSLARFFAHIKWVKKMKNLILDGNVNTVYSHWYNELRHWVPFLLKAAGGKMVFREDSKNLLRKHKKIRTQT